MERMWVLVTQRKGTSFRGRLDNDPFDMPQLKSGTEVSFSDFNIIDIEWKEPETKSHLSKSDEKQIWDRCMVDQDVVDGRLRVGYIYKEEPDLAGENDKFPDSGWRIRGDSRHCTDEEYSARKVCYIAIGSVLNKDDSWLHLRSSPIGSAFTKNYETGEFEPHVRAIETDD